MRYDPPRPETDYGFKLDVMFADQPDVVVSGVPADCEAGTHLWADCPVAVPGHHSCGTGGETARMWFWIVENSAVG